MILRTVHFPAAYRVPDAYPDDCRALHCSVCVQALLDALENCILLVDAEGELRTELARAVSAWPTKHRKRGEALLRRLHDRRRFIEVPEFPVATARTSPCVRALAVAATDGAAWTIVPTTCTCPSKECTDLPDARVVRLAGYVASDFNVRRQTASRIYVAEGDWNRERFEDEVWQPLFAFARFVQLWDRVIGSKATTNGPDLNFRNTLEWILTQFLRHSRKKSSDRPFTIYTAPPVDNVEWRVLNDYAQSLEQAHDFPVRIFQAKVGHDRYLFTDQIQLKVSRGFDLLTGDRSAGPRQSVREVSLDLHRPFAEL